MSTYQAAYNKLIKRGFCASDIDEDKLHYLIATNRHGCTDLSEKSMTYIMAVACKTGFKEE